jgi:hypothetical protein
MEGLMAQRTVARPFNPFLPPELMNPAPIGAQQVPLQAPVPPALASAPRRVPTTVEPPPPAMGASAAPSMPMPMPEQGGGGFMGGMNDFLGSDASLAFAAGLLGGGSTSEAIGRGFSGAYAARNPNGGVTSADLQMYAQAKREGYGGTLMEFMKEMNARQAGTDYGLHPIPYQRADGSIGYAVSNKAGDVKGLSAPEGEFLSPFDKKFNEASGTAAGKVEGEAAGTLDSMRSKLPGLEYVVGELDKLADQATYTVGGQVIDEVMRQSGMEPRDAAVARAKYIAMVDNQILPMLRDTFGAQFTVKEGETLRATLGDPNGSPQEKQAILKAFIEQKKRDIEALEVQTGAAPASGPAYTPQDPLGIR